MPAGSPVLIMRQTPEMARPGQFAQHPRGLVAAMWNDGRVVRCADPSTVGKSYVTGTLAANDRDEILKQLESSDVKGAPKVPHLRLHTATLVTTVNTAAGKDKWTAELPDEKSVWWQLRTRLLDLPLAESRPADAATVGDVSKLE
jgi:hypothetical protein